MTSTTHPHLLALETFLTSHPEIKYTPPSDPCFTDLSKIFVRKSPPETPLAIVHPQTPSAVTSLIKHAKETFTPFTIRSGGHNLEGRAISKDALCIDLRSLNTVVVSPDRKTATVGGGILQSGLGARLWEHGLATATGAIPDVGYAGWAMYGGYGPFSSHWGLGVDQIVGARVVDGQGEIIDADEELLSGIRGAGGVFGVVVELDVRVYPLTGFLAGPILFDSSDIEKAFVTFNTAYNDLAATDPLPGQLTLQRLVFNAPTGLLFGVSFVWSGSSTELEEGQAWIQKIASLCPVILNAVIPTTIPEWSAANGNLPKALFGRSRTHNLSTISDKMARVIGRNLALMPADPGAMFSIHQLRGDSPSAGPGSQEERNANVFVTREPHYMLEILGFASTMDILPASTDWAENMAREIEAAEPESVLPTVYLSLWDSGTAGGVEEVLDRVYGEKEEVVRALKRRVDPEGLFRLAVPVVE